jgi:hypothetical protein
VVPEAADRAAAAVEGWIALPRGTLADLVRTRAQPAPSRTTLS